MEKDIKDKVAGKVADWVEALLAPIIVIAYFDQISNVLLRGKSMVKHGVKSATMWCQYNLPRLVRPFYSLAVILTVSTWILGSIVFWVMVPEDAGTWPYFLWTIFDAVLLITFVVFWFRLGCVRPMSEADINRLKAIPGRFAALRTRIERIEAREALGIIAPTEAQVARIEAINSPVNRRDTQRVKLVRERRFGTGRVMTPTALGLAFMAPLIIGIGLWVMASLSTLAGSHWVLTVQFIIAGLLLGFVTLFLVMQAAVTLGVTARVAGELFVGLFKGGWDSILTTFLPNVTGEEAKELLPKDLGKHVSAAWKLFTSVVLSAPGVIALMVLSLAINWHHPATLILLVGAFIGLSMSTLSSMQTGNDETPARKRAGWIVKTFFWAGFLYRLAELWWFGLPYGGTWYWTPGGLNNPLRTVWNVFVPWWNGLVHMNWWQCILVVIVLAIAITQIVKLPDTKYMNRIKYALVTVCGIGVAIVAIGFIANRASVNAVAHAMPLVVSEQERKAAALAAAHDEAPHVPDAIDRLTAGTAETPPTVVVPVVVVPEAPRVERPTGRASAPRAPADVCDQIAQATDLTDLFRESMRRRHGCDG